MPAATGFLERCWKQPATYLAEDHAALKQQPVSHWWQLLSLMQRWPSFSMVAHLAGQH
jgi:hypothetical protein